MPKYPGFYKETTELITFVDRKLENNSFASYEEVGAAVQTAFGKTLSKTMYNQRLLRLRREKKQEEKRKRD